MIRLPWENGAGAYPELETWGDLRKYMKRRRKAQMVIFRPGGNLLPAKCAKCGKAITERANRVDISPKSRRVMPYHYDCAWETTLAAVYHTKDPHKTKGLHY